MGAGQSARKITINNDDEIDVIKVSKSVVQRLTQKAKETKNEPGNEVRISTLPQPQLNKAASQPPQSGDASVASGYPVYYYPQLTLSALEIQQQKENELRNQDDYWQRRIENLEKHHLKINRIIDEEYKKALEELYSNGEKKANIQETIQPCLEKTEQVLKCYQEYPKEILKCSILVEEFSHCVDQRRARVIDARC